MSNYIVFGASGSIGSELSRRLVGAGNSVLLAARDESRVRDLCAELGMPHHIADATDSDGVEACVSHAVDAFGSVNGIANCAGSLLLKPAHLTTDTEWQSTIATNLTSSFKILRAGAKAMMSSGGSMVFVSSAAARSGLANHEAIAAAKAGIVGLVLSAAASYGAKNIRVNCVAPGLVASQMTSRMTSSDGARKASTAMHALGRLGEPRDVASMIEWLLDPSNAWVTGQVFGIDGGLGTVHTRARS
jgi:NAD(P)-dependent dehydrogenase (short-subunit alcohol dehydrogenase family)